ncbi:unnamed protein product [Pedinophyceae sp. YPF-701]|nr:unnamed protein product [Pedinophyceae sp. YPF-701]
MWWGAKGKDGGDAPDDPERFWEEDRGDPGDPTERMPVETVLVLALAALASIWFAKFVFSATWIALSIINAGLKYSFLAVMFLLAIGIFL